MNVSSLISKYFFPAANDNEFNKWASITLKAALDFLHNRDGQKLHADISPSEISALFRSTNVPEKGEKVSRILKETIENIVKNSVRVSHPNFIGHMTGASPNFLLLCDILISALNQNVVKIESALSATYVEWQTLCWLHSLIYKREENFYKNILNHSDFAIGNCCSGGTIGNITALVAARNKIIPNIHKIGIFEAYKSANCTRAVILVSERGHYSLKKAAAIIGIGEQNVISIPCEIYTNKIDLKELENTLTKLVSENTIPIAIVGIAGGTETGNIDDLKSMAKIARKFNTWFHVDAAWGGALLLSNNYKKLLAGIEEADSVVIDGHKFLYLTLSHGAVLFKDKHSLDSIRHSAKYIIREGSVDLGRTTLEGSRRFDSLKLWFALRTLGKEGYELLINKAIQNAFLFSQMIQKHPSFESTSKQETSITTYRYIPRKLKARLQLAQKIIQIKDESRKTQIKKNFHKDECDFIQIIKNLNTLLNEINVNLQKTQRKNGKSFVSRTTLESVWESQEIVVLRAVPFHPLTNQEIFTEILLEQEALGNTFFERSFEKLIDKDTIALCFFSDT